jgi:hypothetical protein
MLSSSVSHRTDENASLRFTKTPAKNSHTTATTTGNRRAFGDISNRKIARNTPGNTLEIGTSKPVKTTSNIPPTTVGSKKKQQQQPQQPPLPLESSSNLGAKIQPTRRVEFHVPESDPVAEWNDSLEEDDLEMPAGLLWHEQPDWDSYHDNNSVVSLEGAATLRQDTLAAVRNRHQNMLDAEAEFDEQCERLYQQSVWEFLDQEASGTYCSVDKCNFYLFRYPPWH